MWRKLTSVAGASLAIPVAQASAEPAPVLDDPAATWTIAIENDGYFGADDNYTSGVRVGYLSGNRRLDPFGLFVSRHLLRIDSDRDDLRMRRGIALAQEIYTPADVSTAAPLPDQHPYGAYLYGELTSLVEQPGRVDQFAIALGVVGPEALGEESQDFVHRLYDRELARGWDNQIDTAIGVNVTYDQQRRLARSENLHGLGWDLTANAGFSVGTVKTSARIGGNIRFGENLVAGYGPPRIRPTTAGSGFYVPRGRRSWYIFAGGQVEAVGHNIFLDNALFRDQGPSVNSNVIVSDLQSGVAVQLWGAQVSFTYILRTEEYATQDGSQTFGSLSVSKRF